MATRLHLLRHRDNYAQISQRDHDGPILQDRDFVVQPWNCAAERPCLFGPESQGYKPARNIFGDLRAWPKTLRDFAFGKARIWAIFACRGQAGLIILRGSGRGEPC
jgi:hypothetical protein